MTSDEYIDAVRQMPCCVCGSKPVHAHHPLGGSMIEKLGPRGSRKHSDFLALPLCPEHHNQGPDAIHSGVLTWEAKFGKQTDHVTKTGERLKADPWALEAAEQKLLHTSYKRLAKILPRRTA